MCRMISKPSTFCLQSNNYTLLRNEKLFRYNIVFIPTYLEEKMGLGHLVIIIWQCISKFLPSFPAFCTELCNDV